MNDPWRRSKKFNGKVELRGPPKVRTGDEILKQSEHVQPRMRGKHKKFEKERKRKCEPAELNWTKRSIFFKLDYWPKLLLRHNLDVMHIEKNICDNVVGTLLSIEGKTKDTNKARLDIADMKMRKALHLRKE